MRLLASLALVTLVACDEPAPPPAPEPAPAVPVVQTLPVNGVLDVVSTKNGTAEVPGRFEKVSGAISTPDLTKLTALDGKVDVAIGSWNSGVELRDTRVRTTFFEEATFGTATFDVNGLTGLAEGGLAVGAPAVEAKLVGKLSLHGVTRDVELPVKIARVGEQAFTVESTAPYALNSDDYGLTERREALRQECAHESLSEIAKVSLRAAIGTAEVPGTQPPAVTPPEAPTENDKK